MIYASKTGTGSKDVPVNHMSTHASFSCCGHITEILRPFVARTTDILTISATFA